MIDTKQIVKDYVCENIGTFHKNRLDSLKKVSFEKILKRKNPYLFKAKSVQTAEKFVKLVLDAHLSSQEETVFGGFLEGLAIEIASKIYGGQKSAAEGIDLELTKNDVKYIVSIKSGPNWGNSSQINKMKDNFKKAKRILGTNTIQTNVVAINGCCYGKDDNPDKTEYLKLCGQQFWYFLSGSQTLYQEMIEPLGYESETKNEEFKKEYSRNINIFVKEFTNNFCIDGNIDWEKITKINSGAKNF